MLYICTWLWGDKWPAEYAKKLFAGIRRNVKQEHCTVLITDRTSIKVDADLQLDIAEEDKPLLVPLGCLARMRMFEEEWQFEAGMERGDRIVNIDIDAVPTGPMDELFDRNDEFTIMQGFNTTNPCPFNGSLWMFRAGERHDVWNDFSLDAHKKFGVPIHAIADDQGWLHHKFPDAKAYTPQDGVYAFKKKTWPTQDLSMPKGAKLVAFPGRDPAKYKELKWVKENWVC